MNEIMLSIRPKWCELIASGQKTIEIRKTKPKCDVPFKVYIYCTKSSKKYQTAWEYIIINSGELFRLPTGEIRCADRMEMRRRDNYTADNFLNGKVIGEFVCDRIIDVDCDSVAPFDKASKEYIDNQCCLTRDELFVYTQGLCAFGWHISDLTIYDKPKDLSDYKKLNRQCYYADLGYAKPTCSTCCDIGCMLSKPPQSWCYVEKGRESNDG